MLWHKEESTVTLYVMGLEGEDISRYKPEGIAVELADCALRILDYFGKECIDIDEAEIRPEDDNENCELPELVTNCHALISMAYTVGDGAVGMRAAILAEVIARMENWCAKRGCSFSEVIRIKHEYNVDRPYQHGGKVC